MLSYQVMVCQLVFLAHAVHQNDLLKRLIGRRVTDDAHERREASAGRQQIQPLARKQVVHQQRTRGFFADDNRVTHLHMLQTRGQRAIRHLDAQKFQMVFIVGADDAVGPEQRLVIDAQTNHGEVPVAKTHGLVACGGEGEKFVCPVVDGQHTFFVEGAHGCLKMMGSKSAGR